MPEIFDNDKLALLLKLAVDRGATTGQQAEEALRKMGPKHYQVARSLGKVYRFHLALQRDGRTPERRRALEDARAQYAGKLAEQIGIEKALSFLSSIGVEVIPNGR